MAPGFERLVATHKLELCDIELLVSWLIEISVYLLVEDCSSIQIVVPFSPHLGRYIEKKNTLRELLVCLFHPLDTFLGSVSIHRPYIC